MLGLLCEVVGVGSKFRDVMFRVYGCGFSARVLVSGLRVEGLGFRI